MDIGVHSHFPTLTPSWGYSTVNCPSVRKSRGRQTRPVVWMIYRQVRELVTFFINQGHFEESKRILTHFLFPRGYIRKRGGKSRTKLEIGVTGKQNKTKNPKATPPALTSIWAVTRAPQGQSSEGYKPENAIFRQSKGGK